MRLLFLSLTLVVAGCSMAPKLTKPDLPVPAAFPDTPGVAAGEKHPANLDWRATFRDPRLQRIVEIALEQNRDLRLATLNVAAARAQYRIERSVRLPSIEASGSYTRERTTANATPESPSNVQSDASGSLGVSAYEIDLFGRARALSDAAFAHYAATEQGRRAAQITLVAAVADAYFAERLAQDQLALANRTLADWQESLDLARRLKAANQNSELDVAQAEAQVASAKVDVAARARTLARARNALVLLAGTEIPADLPPAPLLDGEHVVTRLPAGVPSELLTRRPDILQAEQSLRAANADIGAARSAFFPRLSLTASVGYSSPELNDLFRDAGRIWNFSPQIVQPIFQGGRLRAELRLAHIRKSAAVAEYERVIQVTFREVADALAGSATYDRQIDAQLQVVASTQKRAELSALRYRAGVDGRLELLDAQRELYSAKQALLELRREEIGNAIDLFKALGGGVNEESPPAVAQQPSAR